MLHCRPLILLATMMVAFTPANENTGVTALTKLRGVSLAFLNHDGSKVVVQMRGGKIGLWDVTSGKAVAGDLGSMKMQGTVSMAPGGKIFAAGFAEGGVRIFDASSAVAISPLLKVALIEQYTNHVEFSPDLHTLLAFDADKRANVFDIESGRQLAQIAQASEPVEGSESGMQCQFSKDGKSCFILDPRGTLIRYNTADWKTVGKPMTHPNPAGYWYDFKLSRDGKFAITSDGPGENGPKGYLQLWDVQTTEPIGKSLEARNGLGGRFLPGGKRLLVTPSRGLAAVYELPGLERLFDLPKHDDVEGPSVRSTRDNQWFLTWGNSTLRVSDAFTGKVAGMQSSKAQVSNVLVSPDSKHCYAVYDNTAFFLDRQYDHYVMKRSLPKLNTVGTIRILDTLGSVSLSPDGSRLLIQQGWDDREQLRVFDAATMQEILPPQAD
jgi:WD40 repeat protein